jgi:NADH-quinone oxidoreductase subunit G
MSSMVTVTIDNKTISVKSGTNLIEAAKQAGVEIPHYCYHPRLSIAGNCRMCLVDIGMPKLNAERQPELDAEGKPIIMFGPKLAIGCNSQVAPGMVVHTRSEKVTKARQGVMEFLLLNHPLDCPICDQAGECRLQEFAVDYGRGASRLEGDKVHKPKQKDLGTKIILDNERCIMCSRCERFMREVPKQDCLGFTQRGTHVELTAYPDKWPNTNYDLNIVDICPVGALTSKDFRFRQRVWFMKETKSVCSSCSTGCNTVISSRSDIIYRQTPRDNDAVNKSWMCDYGRLNYRFINAENRLKEPTIRGGIAITWEKALAVLNDRLDAFSGHEMAIIGSARLSTEELYLLASLAKARNVNNIDCVARFGESDDLLLSADRNPNTAGALLTGAAATPVGSKIPQIAAEIGRGKIRCLIVHGENIVRHGVSADLLESLEFLLVIDTGRNETCESAHLVLPGATFAEKSGTFINKDQRLQRFSPAIAPIGKPDWQILAQLIQKPFVALDQVFAEMAAAHPILKGLHFAVLPHQGIALEAQQ